MADADDTLLLTIVLRHQKDKNLDEIKAKLDAQDFWRHFPPDGVEVVNWHVVMGIGWVITLRLPAARVREVNLAIENCAWGAFDSEFYPTYDFDAVWRRNVAAKRV